MQNPQEIKIKVKDEGKWKNKLVFKEKCVKTE